MRILPLVAISLVIALNAEALAQADSYFGTVRPPGAATNTIEQSGTGTSPELLKLNQQYTSDRAAAISRVNLAMIKALSSLKQTQLLKPDAKAANATQVRIDELSKENADLLRIETPSAAAIAVVASPSASIQPLGVHGEVYIDKHTGQAGFPAYTHDNVYNFDIKVVTGHAAVEVLEGPPTRSSNGEVRLKFNGKSIKLGTWTQEKAKSGKLRYSADDYIKTPGKYSIEIAYTGGEYGLRSDQVCIDTRAP